MRRLIYSMNTSLDGYVAAPGGDISWGVPDVELHQWFNDRARELGASLYGRRLWELMSAHWPTADHQPDATPVEVEFAQIWQQTPKVVFSATLDGVTGNARLVTGDAVQEITRLKAGDGAPMEIGGASLAGAAMRAALIDEYQVVTHPVLVGGGTPFFCPLDSWVTLRLRETRTFPSGVTLARYESGH
jgi:dihydrofolate reductase